MLLSQTLGLMCPKPLSSQSPLKLLGMSWWNVKGICLYLRAVWTFLVYGLPLTPCRLTQSGPEWTLLVCQLLLLNTILLSNILETVRTVAMFTREAESVQESRCTTLQYGSRSTSDECHPLQKMCSLVPIYQ